MRVAKSLATPGSTIHSWTTQYTTTCKAELWKALATDRLANVWITLTTMLSRLYSVASPASSKCLLTASSTRTWMPVFFYRALYPTKRLTSGTTWSASSRVGVLLACAYQQGHRTCLHIPLSRLATTSRTVVFNDLESIGRLGTEAAILDGAAVRLSLQSMRFGLLNMVKSLSHSRRLYYFIKKYDQLKNLKKLFRGKDQERIQRKTGFKVRLSTGMILGR